MTSVTPAKPSRRTLIALALSLPVLAGCVGAAAVGVGAGALVLSDRRVSETYVTDQGIELRAVNRVEEKYRDKVHVNFTSYNRMLLITGEVPTPEIKADVEKLAATVPSVKSITNELAIAGPSSLAARSNDTYLTSKVKARFIDANKFAPTHVKVVTEAGIVFLLGLVTQTEANDAVEIARTTGGVQKVVRVFEIISPDQARQMDNLQAPATKPAPAK